MLLLLFLCAAPFAMVGRAFVWYNGKGSVTYQFNGKKSEVVEMALHLFTEDMRLLTGHAATHHAGGTIEIFELDKLKDKDFKKLQKRNLPISEIIARREAFSLCVEGGHIVILGSDAHGTAYGIMELSRLAGVSPWVDWGDVHPIRQQQLSIPDDFLTIQWPSVAQRSMVVTAKHTDKKRLEALLLRLRGNHLLSEEPQDKAVTKFVFREQWLPCTQPGLVFAELQQAYAEKRTQSWCAVMHHPKVVAYTLSLMMDMAWNQQYVTAHNLCDHYREWLSRQFGATAAQKLLPIMTEYYHLVGIRKPEEMDMELAADAFGNELERYIANYKDLVQAATTVQPLIASEQQDAFFSMVLYPVKAAMLMAEKQLQAQEARHIGRPQSFAHDEEALVSAVRSWHAHQELQALQTAWNNHSHGKWKDCLPIHELPLLSNPPVFPGPLPQEALKTYAHTEPISFTFDTGSTLTRNACDFRKASAGVEKIKLLGHSLSTVRIPPGGWLTHSFYAEQQGAAVLRLAFIPTTQEGEQWIKVRVDNEPPVMLALGGGNNSTIPGLADSKRGQCVKDIPLTLSRNSHQIYIEATDTPVYLDQLMIDYDPLRHFYIFPIVPAL